MVRVFGLCEGSIAVFLREQASVVIGDFDSLAFEEGVAEREEVLNLAVGWSEDLVMETGGGRGFTYFFFVLVFGAYDSLFALVWPDGRYVDE